jgi:hypothetical protein
MRKSMLGVLSNNPHPVSSVRGIDGTSRYNKRPDFVADTLQVRYTLVEAHIDEASNILANDPTRPELVNDTEHFRPEVTVIFRAPALPGNGERLTGEPPTDKVNWFEVVFPDFFDIPIPFYIRPMFGENLVAEIVDFNLPLDRHTSTFKAEVKATDAGKE